MKKVCLKCQKSKFINDFHKQSSNKDNHKHQCKLCIKEMSKKRWQRDKIRLYKQNRQYEKRHPWYRQYRNAQQRCQNPNYDYYEHYGGRGIQLLMIPNEFKLLWFRDKAYNMKKPSIDRINNNGNYTIENCRYIEVSENIAERNRRLKIKRMQNV